MLEKLLCLAAAGALGTLARYGLGGAVQRCMGSALPWGTLAVNVVGCFVAGALWAALEGRVSVSGQTRAVVLVGFMGAFTTFSSFALETGMLARNGEWAWALGNVLLQNVVGLAMLFLGLGVGRII